MKKVLASLTLTGLLIIPALVLGTSPETVPETDIMILLGSVMNWMFAVLLIVAAIFIIIAAFHFVTASGDPEKTKTARNFVLYALIGVLVAFAARGLVELVRLIVQPATT